jgi:hypothetical protein
VCLVLLLFCSIQMSLNELFLFPLSIIPQGATVMFVSVDARQVGVEHQHLIIGQTEHEICLVHCPGLVSYSSCSSCSHFRFSHDAHPVKRLGKFKSESQNGPQNFFRKIASWILGSILFTCCNLKVEIWWFDEATIYFKFQHTKENRY